MNFRDDTTETAFRAEVRSFLDEATQTSPSATS
jgi:hypothetical protein